MQVALNKTASICIIYWLQCLCSSLLCSSVFVMHSLLRRKHARVLLCFVGNCKKKKAICTRQRDSVVERWKWFAALATVSVLNIWAWWCPSRCRIVQKRNYKLQLHVSTHIRENAMCLWNWTLPEAGLFSDRRNTDDFQAASASGLFYEAKSKSFPKKRPFRLKFNWIEIKCLAM